MPCILRTATLAAVACGMSLTISVAPAPATVRQRRRHRGGRTTHTLKVIAHDDARSLVDDDHPGFRLSLRRGETVAAGLVRVQFINKSNMMEHQATLARLHDGVSLTDFMNTVRSKGDDAALRLVDVAGGANTVAPRGHQTTWQELRAGRYVVICLVAAPDGKSHLDLGMINRFRVTGTPTGRRRPPGDVKGTITAETNGKTMTFRLPRHFTGHGLYRFHNTADKDLHELAIVRLAPGKTRQDVIDWFTHPGPPPFTGAGGVAATMPGAGGWLRLDLRPGTYVATCFVPDDESPHLPHGALGMDVEFTIR